MASFLEHIAEQYKVEHRDSLKDHCFVFPSRRASLYFKDILKEQNQNQPFWAPATFSIEEFVQEHCPDLQLADNLQLILKLYSHYTKNGGSEAFDEFYSWGNVLLNDFDQIDRYLVDGEKVYKNLQEIDNLEATFGPSEELLKALKSFKKVLDDGKDGRLTQNFNENWLLVGKMYIQLRTELINSGKGYMGLLYHSLASKLGDESVTLPYREVVFAGFNAITASEEVIISKLLKQGKAKIFFDADHYYLNDDKEEAGHFLRKNKSRWYKHPKVEWVIGNAFAGPKTIDIIGIEQQVAQTRAAVEVIKDYGVESTAIVMGDENLISPMLYSLPSTLGEVNITMGFPISGSGLANLARAFFKYQESATITKEGKEYVSRELLHNLTQQPALKGYLGNEFRVLQKGKSAYLNFEQVKNTLIALSDPTQSLISPLFKPGNSVHEAIDILIEFLSKEYYTSESEGSILQNGVRLTLLKHLGELKSELQKSEVKISFGVLDKILRESFKQLSTPFSGEPLANLQVMGFLESRALDFDNLVLLSVNEDTIPAGSGSNSYIPFNIRKAFGLPTFLDQNAIYAYHFFRLLQRAKNITLVYSTQLSVTGSGEQSRFIYQLAEKARSGKTGLHINRKTWSPRIPPVSSDTLTITVSKQGLIADQVEAHLQGFQEGRILTPTQLTDYITCPFKYYLARVQKLKEPEEVSEKIGARTFGNLLHELLETMYKPWIGKSISEDEIAALIKGAPQMTRELFKDYDSENGESKFSEQLILHLAKAILSNDKEEAPIFIHDLESKESGLKATLTVNDQLKVSIGGFIDRLDMIRVDGQDVHRVLDYKTGKTELKSTSFKRQAVSDEDYVTAHFTDPKYKSGFQLLFYMMVLKLMNPGWALNGGIVGVRRVSSGIDYLRGTSKPVSPEIITLFSTELKKLVEEIADPAIPFSQTEDTDNCKYCQFKRICSR